MGYLSTGTGTFQVCHAPGFQCLSWCGFEGEVVQLGFKPGTGTDSGGVYSEGAISQGSARPYPVHARRSTFSRTHSYAPTHLFSTVVVGVAIG